MIDLIFEIMPSIHGAGHDSGGLIKFLEDFLAFLETLGTKNAKEIFAAFFPGISSLKNLHPLVVHFPITLFSLFFCADSLGCLLKKIAWRHFATGLLYLGTFSAMLTIILGLQAAYSVEHNDMAHNIMLRHQTFGISLTLLAFFLSLRRFFAHKNFLNEANYGYLSLSALLVILMIFTADLGGLMVYKYGVAVDAAKSNTITPNKVLQYFSTPQSRHTHNHGADHHAH